MELVGHPTTQSVYFAKLKLGRLPERLVGEDAVMLARAQVQMHA